MLLSWGLILGLNLFCFTLLFSRTETAPPLSPRRNRVSEEEEEEIT